MGMSYLIFTADRETLIERVREMHQGMLEDLQEAMVYLMYGDLYHALEKYEDVRTVLRDCVCRWIDMFIECPMKEKEIGSPLKERIEKAKKKDPMLRELLEEVEKGYEVRKAVRKQMELEKQKEEKGTV